MEGIQCVLLDIEGTVCPISFVKETLFPYALRALPSVLAANFSSPEFAPYLDAFPAPYRKDPETLQAHVEDLTRRDVKVAYLKDLQGYLWEEGYRSGAYATPLFGDVGPELKGWKGRGVGLAIYSSGSVRAQKLLFGHVQADDSPSTKGEESTDVPEGPPGASSASSTNRTAHYSSTEDLTGLFEGWFDTSNAGLKTETSSYIKIAKALQREPKEILFLSDNVKEVDAALDARMRSILVDRPGNAPVTDAERKRLRVVDSFGEIEIA